MFFYGIFSCTLFLRRDVAVPVACGALISLIAVGKMAAPEFGPFQVWTDPIMLEFVFGMLIALLYRHNIALPWFARAALIAAGACAVWLFAVPGTVPTTGMRWLYWGVPAAAIFAGVTLGKPVNFGWLTSPLKIIGDSSYALYLFHSMVGAAVIIYWGTLSRYPLYKTLAVAIVVAILLAITIYHLIERPAADTPRHRRRTHRDDRWTGGIGAPLDAGFGRPEISFVRRLVPQTGLEPVTPSLRMTCSTN
jgi:exopolysaccharide production protein ExoZ